MVVNYEGRCRPLPNILAIGLLVYCPKLIAEKARVVLSFGATERTDGERRDVARASDMLRDCFAMTR